MPSPLIQEPAAADAGGAAGPSMTSRAAMAIGIGQLVNWGVLYYAFAVLLLPLEAELGVPRWTVAGAFSGALLVAAAAAPAVGRRLDRHDGSRALHLGGLTAGVILVLWTLVPGVAALYVVWAALGCCMAATLYEPAFAAVARRTTDPSTRLRALALVTLLGGLASSVFLPLTAVLVRAHGWRVTVCMLGTALVVTASGTHWWLGTADSRQDRPTMPGMATVSDRPPSWDRATRTPPLVLLTAVFALGSCASAALVTSVVPALVERGTTPTVAALLASILGVMQLPGRALLLSPRVTASPATLLVVSLLLQMAGLILLTADRGLMPAAAGLSVFAAGSGLSIIVRPYLVQTTYAAAQTGYIDGRVAQGQQFARAVGPVLAGTAAGLAGYGTVFLLFAVLFGAAAMTARRLAPRASPAAVRQP